MYSVLRLKNPSLKVILVLKSYALTGVEYLVWFGVLSMSLSTEYNLKNIYSLKAWFKCCYFLCAWYVCDTVCCCDSVMYIELLRREGAD
jgi:hypothetical protein